MTLPGKVKNAPQTKNTKNNYTAIYKGLGSGCCGADNFH